MTSIILEKENGIIKKINPDEKLVEMIKNKEIKHMCAEDCANCGIGCPKVADVKKKTIDKYDFITDGIQIVDETGDVDTFVVTKCKNYVREIRKPLTIKEEDELKKTKESMLQNYYDNYSLEEAKRLKEEHQKSIR